MIMDRLPLVQALTAAGLERTGAEHVAAKAGLSRLDAATKAEFGTVGADTLETRLTVRRGGIVVAAIGRLFAVPRFAVHTP